MLAVDRYRSDGRITVRWDRILVAEFRNGFGLPVSRTSNRKVPSSEVGGLDGDDPARAFIEAQDRTIAERSGTPRGPIKTIARSQA